MSLYSFITDYLWLQSRSREITQREMFKFLLSNRRLASDFSNEARLSERMNL